MRLLQYAGLAIGSWIASAGPNFRIYVASESGDIISQLTWDGTALKTVKQVPVGLLPVDIDGPHNVALSSDGKYYYVTIAHGMPYGSLWKMAVDGDTLVGRAPVEMFPTTIGLTPDGDLAFVANSDFHGDHPRMNVVSVIYTPSMTPLVTIPACDMPHGVKSNHAGTRVYVTCMNSDEVLEIDRATLAITRRHRTGTADVPMTGMGHGGGGAQGRAFPMHDECMPTFVSLSLDDSRIYLACNHTDALQVLDAATLELIKSVPVGHGAYNVEPSPDGKWVIVTNKKDKSISLVDATTLTEVARIPVTKTLPHGVAWSPDSRYAFISIESVGTDSGAVNVIDLSTRTNVAQTPIPLQPTGISILRLP